MKQCISKWGSGFRPDYEALSIKRYFPVSPNYLQLPALIKGDIAQKPGNARIIVHGFDRLYPYLLRLKIMLISKSPRLCSTQR